MLSLKLNQALDQPHTSARENPAPPVTPSLVCSLRPHTTRSRKYSYDSPGSVPQTQICTVHVEPRSQKRPCTQPVMSVRSQDFLTGSQRPAHSSKGFALANGRCEDTGMSSSSMHADSSPLPFCFPPVTPEAEDKVVGILQCQGLRHSPQFSLETPRTLVSISATSKQ